ncbi:hypothetical protein BDR06DRAFT_1014874 [Suillus hirtellus]|nr:hypothetical protein BDR06DRAFT_1014874 [Suillus hirtellus]
MSKHAVSSDDAPTGKHIRMDEGSQTALLVDEHAWRILEEFLTTDMTYPWMEEAFLLPNPYLDLYAGEEDEEDKEDEDEEDGKDEDNDDGKGGDNDNAWKIGDSIDVLMGEHIGKSGIVHWLSKGGNYLWFQHESLNIPVPIKVVQRIFKPQTLQYTQDKGYNVNPGDVMRVAHGSEYPMKGVMKSVDFPNACLTLLSEINHSLVHIAIGFMIKVYNVSLDSFKKDIGQEVFIIEGGHKGY